jgi:hypothetical protein
VLIGLVVLVVPGVLVLVKAEHIATDLLLCRHPHGPLTPQWLAPPSTDKVQLALRHLLNRILSGRRGRRRRRRGVVSHTRMMMMMMMMMSMGRTS